MKKGTEMRKRHTAEFDIDKDSLVTGVANLSCLVYIFLSNRHLDS
jgi:hypothetical protein